MTNSNAPSTRRSLRSKLIAVFLGPTLLIVALYGSLAYFSSRQGLEDELGKRLNSIASTIAAQMSEGVDAKQIARLDSSKGRVIARLRDRLLSVQKQTGVRRIRITSPARKSLVDTGDEAFDAIAYELEPHVEEFRRAQMGEPSSSVLFSGPEDVQYKMGFAPITVEGETVAVVVVEASASYFELLENFATALLVLALLAFVLVIGVAAVFASRLTDPINRLMIRAQQFGRGDLEAPVEIPNTNDEIAFFAQAFDEMRTDILDRDVQMKMMLSGIAHEVRNPLGGMKLFCSLLEEDLESSQHNHLDELEKVSKIQRELGYLERVVDDFLDFARDVPADMERFNASEFLDDVAEIMRGEFIDRGAELSTVAPEELELSGDRQKLRRALFNVIRNATQSTRDPVNVHIEVIKHDNGRKIVVSDDGPGIPPDVLEEILTPFFTTKEKGSGLGLSLTQRIMAQHRGAIDIDSTVGKGTVVTFTVPFDESIESATAIPEGWLG